MPSDASKERRPIPAVHDTDGAGQAFQAAVLEAYQILFLSNMAAVGRPGAQQRAQETFRRSLLSASHVRDQALGAKRPTSLPRRDSGQVLL
jgi:hypothetical protein